MVEVSFKEGSVFDILKVTGTGDSKFHQIPPKSTNYSLLSTLFYLINDQPFTSYLSLITRVPYFY